MLPVCYLYATGMLPYATSTGMLHEYKVYATGMLPYATSTGMLPVSNRNATLCYQYRYAT